MASRQDEVPNERRNVDDFVRVDAARRPARLGFGPFVLDPESGRLLDGHRAIPLAHQPFETLLYLASHSGRVISKSQLMEKLWPGTFVTDDVLVQCVVDIRKALGDTAKDPHYIQTIPRRGYLFMVPVTAVPAPIDSGDMMAVHAAASHEPSVEQRSAPLAGFMDDGRGVAPDQRRGLRRRNAWLRWSPAGLALLVAIGAGLVGWQRHAGVPEEAPADAEPGSLLVMPLGVEEPRQHSDWLREGLAEMIRAELGQTPGIHLVARHRLAAALADAGYDEVRNVPADRALRVARGLKAERLVSGSFFLVEDRFVINAQLVDVATGRVDGTTSVRGAMPRELLDAVDDLCLRLLHQLRPVKPSGTEPWKPTRLATRSLEASRDYVEALGLYARGGREGAEQAVARLDAALRRDPSFAQAYVKKAEIQHWQQTWGYGQPDPAPAVRAAVRLVRDLPDRERLLVESFNALVVRRQPAAALKQWISLLQLYPTYSQEVGVPALAADTLLRLGRWDELIVVGEAHVDSPSLHEADRARLSSLLAQAFRHKGEIDRAVQYGRRAVDLWPTRSGPGLLAQRALLGRCYVEAGRRGEAVAELRAVASSPDADVVNLTDAAWGFYMATEPGEAQATVQHALKLDPGYGNAWHLTGWLELARGAALPAAEALETAFERTPPTFGNPHQGLVNGDLAALYYAGVAWQKAGDAEKGRRALHRLVDICRQLQKSGAADGAPALQWQAESYEARAHARLGEPASDPSHLGGDDTTYFVQTARLHALQGRRGQALAELAQGVALGFGELRHVQDDPDFEVLRADPEFRRLVTDRLPPR